MSMTMHNDEELAAIALLSFSDHSLLLHDRLNKIPARTCPRVKNPAKTAALLFCRLKKIKAKLTMCVEKK
jgi:hypothetical protein